MSLLQKTTFCAPSQGKKLLILGAVHGNEPCGAEASFRLIEDFKCGKKQLQSGSVTFIPICNPEARARNVRQIEENLNRIIRPYPHPKTYEQRLADEIDKAISQADVIIDLHSTFSPLGQPFIFSDYSDPLADSLTADQNIRYILKGWPEVYAKSATEEDFSTGACAHRYSKTALTIECGHHDDPKAVRTALEATLRAMMTLRLLKATPHRPTPKQYIRMDALITKAKSGHLAREFVHLDPIRRGEILAVYDDGTYLTAPQDGYVLLPKAYADVNAEWFYLGHAEAQPKP